MPKTIKYTSDNPVLNNPYEEPRYYYNTDLNGNIDYTTIKEGRRPFGYDINIVPNKTDNTFFSQDDLENKDPNAAFINGIRKEVKVWREAGYPKSTRITKELLDFWFCDPDRKNNLKLFFCQREAVETAIWLNEIAEKDPNIGSLVLRELMERCHTVSDNDDDVLPRTAFKMATGTGKTVVMAMLILYNYLNKRANPQDVHYADHFLICAPGITIRDRLGVLQLDNVQRGNIYNSNDYYHQRNLIPIQFEKELGGLNASITIINFQQFQPRVFSGKHASPMDGKLVFKDGELVKQKDTESYSVMLSRILEKGVKGKRMIVINDEAHHCYLPKKAKLTDLDADEKDDLKNENDTAMVWYEGLRQMKLNGYKIQHVYDLSATPYYLKGSGYPEYSLFPWVVSDFGLVDAIESGLVKIPYLPAWDNSKNKDLDEPKLRNIYKYIKDKLPKRGQKSQKKKDKEENVDRKSMPVQAPNLPTLLNTALEQFINDYVDYARGLREQYEEAGGLMTSPPVMIIVCNNTTVSREVYREIAGYQDGVDENGVPKYHKSKYDVFSNYDGMGLPKSKFPTLLIDSAALDEASSTIDEAFKRAYAKEIEDFKREFVNQGLGNREDITDGDILREVVNTVGKPGKLGADIKCVVSVSMLTEGWDANTVTHVCGIRAFGSQLLCEQVVGRALRRQSYDLTAYDLHGNVIDPKDIHRYKEENITYKFPPEYARIIGVPFNSFKGGQTVVTPPQKPKTIVRGLKDRAAFEIKFPVMTGYRSENEEGTLTADFTGLPKFKLNFNEIPTETILRSAVSKDLKELQTDYEDLRDEQVVYYFSHLMIREFYTSPDHGPQFQKFPAMKNIVRQWYDNQVETIGGDGSAAQKRLVLLWKKDSVLNSINEGIHQANAGREKITAVLNYYNPEETTAHVFRPTNKPVFATTKSQINYVILSEKVFSWEETVAKMLESIDGVVSYARNQYLGLRIPYTVADETRDFQPDFIVKVKGKQGKEENIILELHDFNSDEKGFKEEKRHYLEDYWIPAANEMKSYGTWSVIEANDVDTLSIKLNEKINSL